MKTSSISEALHLGRVSSQYRSPLSYAPPDPRTLTLHKGPTMCMQNAFQAWEATLATKCGPSVGVPNIEEFSKAKALGKNVLVSRTLGLLNTAKGG